MGQQRDAMVKGQSETVAPHGGHLVNRIATAAQQQAFLEQANSLPRVQLNERAISDLELIAIGGFSPLIGFMEQPDYERVVADMRLSNGLPWSIPITLSVAKDVAAPL
ncbi:MAG TPA: hypothetical protein V6D03_16410, partial [Candidatus Caenarcaniphilales bacterium]